jgi:hypothetical protein
MKEVTIIFNSGAKVSFKANEFGGSKNGFGELVSVDWNCDGLSEYPLRINIDHIDAIMVKEMEGTE